MMICSCKTDITPVFSLRSGPVDNDDVEEPLSDMVREFQPALKLSNEILDLIKIGRVDEIYEKYSDPLITDAVSKDGFRKLIFSAETSVGRLVSYKPMQWNFTRKLTQGISTLASTKVVRYEKGSLNYTFTFRAGNYEKIIGINFIERK